MQAEDPEEIFHRRDQPGMKSMRRKGVRSTVLSAPSATAALVLDLLAFAADESAHKNASWKAQVERGIEPGAMRHLGEAGLKPLLFAAARPYIERFPLPQREELLSAELTALVRHGSILQVAREVVALGQELQVPVTLLKGISISGQHYPSAHLRPMGDIDILVSTRHLAVLQSALLERGFVSDQGDWSEAAHAAPLCHPESDVWVEVHHALFPKGSALLTNALFGPELIAAQSLPFEFEGVPVRRLSNELQLAYIASYWIRDLSMQAVHPSFLIPLLDAVVLLENAAIDWKGMLGWMDNEVAAASLYIMLSYLARHGLAGSSTTVLPRLASRQQRVGKVELFLIHAMLDRWLLGGVSPALGWHASCLWEPLLSPRPLASKMVSLPWKVVFPEWNADRYSARRLLRIAKRSVNKVRGRP
jgi:hypothetical protein